MKYVSPEVDETRMRTPIYTFIRSVTIMYTDFARGKNSQRPLTRTAFLQEIQMFEVCCSATRSEVVREVEMP